MVYILGIHNDEDSGVALLKDGLILEAVSEERFSRKKLNAGFPSLSLRYVLDKYRLNSSDINHISFGWHAADNEIEPYLLRQVDFLRRSRLDQSPLAYERYIKRLEVEIERNAKTRIRFEGNLADLGFCNSTVHYINHHLSHCYGSYSLSPFQEAYSFSFDGRGDLESSACYFFSSEHTEKLNFELTISSLGLLYGQITAYLGFKPHRHEGKITGLSARGNPTKTRPIFDEIIKLENCSLYPNLELYNPFYKPIDSNLASQLSNHSPEDVAAGLQEFTQSIITNYITQTLEASNVRSPVNICLSGGVAANVLLNMHIRNLPLCKNLFVFPHMGDGGIPLGSALYTSSQLGFSSNHAPTSMYLGPDYCSEAILSSLSSNSSRVAYESSDAPDLEAAQCLANGSVVGWFQSRMEYGPRALCNRSILAPAVDAAINKTLNARMHRTEFMPFAPVTADTFAATAFPNIPQSSYSEYRFMTITVHASPEFASMHPAVIHVDGTCRPQIVTQEDNPIMHRLLHSYHSLTGNTALVNTSFNSHEEPIVCSPCDAIAALLSGIVDVLFIGNYRVTCKQ